MTEEPQNPELNKILEQISKKLIDDGKLVDAGFSAFRQMVISAEAPEIQISEMRMAFFAGAQHTMSSIMAVLDPGSEPTDDDLKVIESIMKELDVFSTNLLARVKEKQG